VKEGESVLLMLVEVLIWSAVARRGCISGESGDSCPLTDPKGKELSSLLPQVCAPVELESGAKPAGTETF